MSGVKEGLKKCFKKMPYFFSDYKIIHNTNKKKNTKKKKKVKEKSHSNLYYITLWK